MNASARTPFLVGIGIGLLLGFAAGTIASFGFISRAQKILQRRSESRRAEASAHRTPGEFPEPALAPLSPVQTFNYSVAVERSTGLPADLRELRGKVVVLNLWATWCAPCLTELPEIEALRRRFKDDPRISFVGISKDTREAFKSYVERNVRELPLLRLSDGAIIVAAGDMVPVTLVIDSAENVVVAERGAAKWNSDRVYQFLLTLVTKSKRAAEPSP